MCVCSLATAAVEFRRFSFNRKLGRFDLTARILHSNCLIFRHFSSHHHQYWPIFYFRFLYICGHFHRTIAFLSKLIFFHTIIEWFKNVMPIQLLFLTQFFLNNYYLLRIVNGHHVEFFFGIFFFRSTWSVWMNCFAKQKHTVSKSVIIGKPANLLIDSEYIDWMRHLLIMNALFSLSGKLILFFLSNHVEHSNWVNWDEIISHSNIYEPSSIHTSIFSSSAAHLSSHNIYALLSLLSELMCSFHRLCEPNKGFIF